MDRQQMPENAAEEIMEEAEAVLEQEPQTKEEQTPAEDAEHEGCAFCECAEAEEDAHDDDDDDDNDDDDDEDDEDEDDDPWLYEDEVFDEYAGEGLPPKFYQKKEFKIFAGIGIAALAVGGVILAIAKAEKSKKEQQNAVLQKLKNVKIPKIKIEF